MSCTAKKGHVKIVHCQPPLPLPGWHGIVENAGLVVEYELRLGEPHLNGRLLYEGQFVYPVRYLSKDIYHHIITDLVKYGPCLISFIGLLPTFPQDFVVFVVKPNLDLTVMQKRGRARIWAM